MQLGAKEDEVDKERLEKLLATLRQNERQAALQTAWLQGRIAQVEELLVELEKPTEEDDGDDTGTGALSGGGS